MRVAVHDLAMSIAGRKLFHDVNFDVHDGEIVALMGPSGSGKSTLLAGLSGLLPLDDGSVTFQRDTSAHDIHWVFQTTSLLGRRSAQDNVALLGELRGLTHPQALSEATRLLESLGLGDRVHERAFRLSGGEKQRVAIARALAAQAKVILADEPTAALDPFSRSAVVDALQSAAHAGAAVIIATHDAWVAERCHRIVDLGAA